MDMPASLQLCVSVSGWLSIIALPGVVCQLPAVLLLLLLRIAAVTNAVLQVRSSRSLLGFWRPGANIAEHAKRKRSCLLPLQKPKNTICFMATSSLERQMEQMKPLLANKKLHDYGKPIWRGILFPSSWRMTLNLMYSTYVEKCQISNFKLHTQRRE